MANIVENYDQKFAVFENSLQKYHLHFVVIYAIILSIAEIEDVLDLLALLAQKYSIYYLLRPNLIDEKDNLFVECAFASNSEYLITSNVRDFKSGELKGFKFQIITPGDFYQLWRQKHE